MVRVFQLEKMVSLIYLIRSITEHLLNARPVSRSCAKNGTEGVPSPLGRAPVEQGWRCQDQLCMSWGKNMCRPRHRISAASDMNLSHCVGTRPYGL